MHHPQPPTATSPSTRSQHTPYEHRHERFIGAQAVTAAGQMGRIEQLTHHGRVVLIRLADGTLARERVELLRTARGPAQSDAMKEGAA